MTGRMKMKRIIVFALVVLSAAAFISCDPDPFTGTIKDGIRNITIDVENSMFNLPTEALSWEQGPGITDITFTIVLEGGSGSVDKILTAAEAASGNYTQIVQEVTGKLLRIDAIAKNAAGTSFAISIEDKPEYEIFSGWEIFANVTRFKLAYNGDSTDSWADGFLALDIAPRGGTGIKFKIDSGVTASMTTDWGGAALTTRQLAVEPVLSENPAGLSFDIYTLIVDENLRENYKPGYITPGADYEYNPWEDVWSFDEISSTGKVISDTTYTLTKDNSGDPLPFVEPVAAGYNSFLIDLTSEDDDPVGKFLLIAVVSKYDVLSVPSAVDVVEIK
jgi:hypothetical protein